MNPLPSFSLYIHVPFCVQKCRYCDFYSEKYGELAADAYIEALMREWQLAKAAHGLEGVRVDTLYFGGGTPSVLSRIQWEKLCRGLVGGLSLSDGYEWTVECNPDSFSPDLARFWLDSGVTRLSLGVQSLCDRELSLLGRPHNSRRALEVLDSPALAEFKSVGVDIMYGLPGQTGASLNDTLEMVFSFPFVRHLSAYELTIAGRTPFGRHRRMLPLPSEDGVVEMAELVLRKAAEHGLRRYEISNFAANGHRCRHNEAYWRHAPYIGLGPSAHSYVPPVRLANADNLAEYMASIRNGKMPTNFSETIDRETLKREMVFLGLRTVEGVDEEDFQATTGEAFFSGKRKAGIEGFLGRGLMTYCKPFWSLSEKGMLLADAIARELM